MSRLPADCQNQASAPRTLTFCPGEPKGRDLCPLSLEKASVGRERLYLFFFLFPKDFCHFICVQT